MIDIPYTWPGVASRLKKDGYDEAERDAARVGYELGYHAALVQLGATSTPKNMAVVWREYMDAAKADAKDALERSKR